MSLAHHESGAVVLASRRLKAEDGPTSSTLVIQSLDGRRWPAPPMPAEYESARAAVDRNGQLRIVWTGERRAAPKEDATTGTRAGLFTSTFDGSNWSPAETDYGHGAVRADGAGDLTHDAANTAHLFATGYVPGQRLPRMLHFRGVAGNWSSNVVPAPMLYPRLSALGSGDLLLVSIGARTGTRDSNSLWATRFDAMRDAWDRPVLVSASGIHPAYEPAVMARDGRIDLVWTKDVRGDRSTREALLHTYSTDAGRTWSKPVQITGARHLWSPELIPVGERDIAVLYLSGARNGRPGRAYMGALDGGRWRGPRRILAAGLSDIASGQSADGTIDLVFARVGNRRPAEAGTYHMSGSCANRKEVTAGPDAGAPEH